MYFPHLLVALGSALAFAGVLIVFAVSPLPGRLARVLGRSGMVGAALLAAGIALAVVSRVHAPISFALPPMMQSMAPGGLPPSLPVTSALRFLFANRQERVSDIGADPAAVPAPIARTFPKTVEFHLTAKEVVSEVAPGIFFNYWTYDGQVPGPMLRVRQGDTVFLSLTNDASSLHPHNIDLHAVTGPGGGAALTNVEPGETKSFRWKALQPGLYEYHCAMANVSVHNAHGQYGLILVEPPEGFAPVDREFYVMQGELYTEGGLGAKGLRIFDPQAVLDGNPTYVTFNGRVEDTPRLKAKVGERIRMYVGNGGVNLISSFHVIGEIFDVVHLEGGIGGPPAKNIQSTAVLPGGAAIVEFALDVPGKYLLVDHALARMNKGAWAMLEVEGAERPDVYAAVKTPSGQ